MIYLGWEAQLPIATQTRTEYSSQLIDCQSPNVCYITPTSKISDHQQRLSFPLLSNPAYRH